MKNFETSRSRFVMKYIIIVKMMTWTRIRGKSAMTRAIETALGR